MSINPYRPSQADSGQEMANSRLIDFSGGLVNVPQVLGQAGVAANQLIVAQNVDVTGKSIRKQQGFSKVTTSTVTGDISSGWYDRTTNTNFVSWGTNAGTLSGTSLTPITGATSFTSNKTMSFSRLNDYVFMCNGTNAPKLWDTATSTLSSVTTPPSTWGAGNYPAFAKQWAGRLFAAGCAQSPDLLFYSTLYDLTTWAPGITATNGGAFQIGNDGSPIVAIIPLAQALLVIKDKGLYYFTGSLTFNTSTQASQFDQTTFDYQLINGNVNACSWQSVVAITDNQSDAIYVWGTEQVFRLGATLASSKINTQVISNNIVYSVKNTNKTYAQNFCATHYPERCQIWFSVAGNSGSTGIDTVWIYDYMNINADNIGGWVLRNGYSHKSMWETRDSLNNHQIYSGGYAAAPYVYEQNNTYDFDGFAMACYASTAWFPLGVVGRGKVNEVVFLLSSNTTAPIQYQWQYDFATGFYGSDQLNPPSTAHQWTVSTGSVYGDNPNSGNTGQWVSSPPFVAKIPIFGKGRRIQHQFYCNVLGANFEINEILYPTTSVGYN